MENPSSRPSHSNGQATLTPDIRDRLAKARVTAAWLNDEASDLVDQLQWLVHDMGLSDAGVMTVLKGLGSLSDSIGTGVEQYGTSKETGKHALAGLSKADAELFTKWGSRAGWVGNIAQLVIAGTEYPDNNWNPTKNSERPPAVCWAAPSAEWPLAQRSARSAARSPLPVPRSSVGYSAASPAQTSAATSAACSTSIATAASAPAPAVAVAGETGRDG